MTPPGPDDEGAPAPDPEGDEALPGAPGVVRTAPRSVSELHLKGILESLVFVSEKPVTVQDLARVARADGREIRKLLFELRDEYRGRGIQLEEVAGAWHFRSSVANAPFVREYLQAKPVKLTRAQVEALAVVAYRQPVTRPEVDEIRGVDSGSALKVLLERSLVRMIGRKEEPGRPMLYGTTAQFLEFFGLRSLRDLPTLREFTELSEESAARLAASGLRATDPQGTDGTETPAEPPAEAPE